MARTLIAYFSRAGENYFGGDLRYVDKGNTEIAAEIVKNLTDADIFRIEMKEPYSDAYNRCIDEAKRDLKEGKRPEIVPFTLDMGGYDTLVLGYPNYWGTVPMAVLTFLESIDMSGKRILPFCTNEGSGMGSSVRFIKKLCPGAEVMDGTPIHGAEAANADREAREIASLAK